MVSHEAFAPTFGVRDEVAVWFGGLSTKRAYRLDALAQAPTARLSPSQWLWWMKSPTGRRFTGPNQASGQPTGMVTAIWWCRVCPARRAPLVRPSYAGW